MSVPTLDEVLELAKQLPLADQQRLVRLLNPSNAEQAEAERRELMHYTAIFIRIGR